MAPRSPAGSDMQSGDMSGESPDNLPPGHPPLSGGAKPLDGGHK